MQLAALKKISVVCQITAIVFLQLYAALPLFSDSFSAQVSRIRCTGDHKQCGCSSARIASKNCCCFKSGKIVNTSPLSSADHGLGSMHVEDSTSSAQCAMSQSSKNSTDVPVNSDVVAKPKDSCCDTIQSENKTASKDSSGQALPVLSSSPCGGATDFILASIEKTKFLRKQILFDEPVLSSIVQYHFINIFQDRFLEPPVPPPQLSIPA